MKLEILEGLQLTDFEPGTRFIEPYIHIRVGEASARTYHSGEGGGPGDPCNPVWNQSFTFPRMPRARGGGGGRSVAGHRGSRTWEGAGTGPRVWRGPVRALPPPYPHPLRQPGLASATATAFGRCCVTVVVVVTNVR